MARSKDRRRVYQRQLRSKRWKDFRQRVLERDGFRCVKCGVINVLFHAHHTYYYDGDYPIWAYPLEAMRTLCEDCHNGLHNDLRRKHEHIPLMIHPNDTHKKKSKRVRKQEALPPKIKRKLEEVKRSRGITGKGRSCLAYIQEERMRKREEQSKNNLQ